MDRDHTNGDKKAKLYLPDEKNLIGGFKCLHNHCQGKGMEDVLEFLGLSEVDAQGRDKIKLINQRSDLTNDANYKKPQQRQLHLLVQQPDRSVEEK